MNWTNYHSHTEFSDGKGKPKKYAKRAAAMGLQAYGFSDHAPFPLPCEWAMKASDLKKYIKSIKELKKEFKDQLEIYTSLEVDYIPDVISINSEAIKELPLDYTIGSVHYVDQFADGTPWCIDGPNSVFKMGLNQLFEGDIRMAVHRYYQLVREMVSVACPTIIGHLDRIKRNNKEERYFSEEKKWYRKEVKKTLETIAQSDAIMEVNTKGYYKKRHDEAYPSTWILELSREMNIPVHIASDAHHPDDIVAGFEFARKELLKVGYKEVRILLNDKWQSVPLSAYGEAVVSTKVEEKK